MNDRLSRIKASIRFGLWKAKTYHTTRYVSFIILVATLVGASFFASNNPDIFIKRAGAAASATWVPSGGVGGTLTVTGTDSKYMLLQNGGCGVNLSSLLPMNYPSSSKITNDTITGFIGRVCVPTGATSTVAVTVSNSAELSIVGDTTLGSLTAITNGIITTAPADAHGKAVPYATKDDFWAVRFTGFIEINNTSPIAALYTVEPMDFNGGSWDDSLVVEIDDVAIDTGNINNRNNFRVFSWKQFACNSTDHLFHQSFYKTSDTCNGGVAGQLTAASQARSLSVPPGQHFYAISIMGWESSGKARFAVGTTKNGSALSTVRSSNLYNAYLDSLSGGVTGNVDFGSSGNMRFEYGIGASTGTNRAVARDFSNVATIGGQYYFFPTVNLSESFRGFDQINAGDWSYFFSDPTETVAGEPFSNAQNGTGTDYRIGARPSDVTTVALMQNYKLQNHDDTKDNTTAINAGLRLTVKGNVALSGGGKIDVLGKGLPGGADFVGTTAGASGIGGYGHTLGTLGWWKAIYGNTTPFGSNWQVHGGGGGGSNGLGAIGPGGGGGGAIGAGAGGMNVDDTGAIMTPGASGYFDGTGGGGINGLGGGLSGTPGTVNINDLGGTSFARFNGGSNRGTYSSTTTTGMGGGAGQGAGATYSSITAGSGGGIVNLNIIGGDLTISTGSSIDASGQTIASAGPGGGGAGTVNLRVSGTINLDGNSYVRANGGGSTTDTTYAYGDSTNGYHKGGEGGGGLIKIRATNYAGAGIPPIDDYCSDLGKPFLPTQKNLEVKKGGGQAEDGLTDLGVYDATDPNGKPICGGVGSGASTPDIQISKRLQQYNNGAFKPGQYNDIVDETKWSDSVTTVPSTSLRVQVVIRNPSSEPRTVNVKDTVPVGVDLQKASDNRNVAIKSNDVVTYQSNLSLDKTTGIVQLGLTVAASSTTEVMYVVQVNIIQ